MYKVGLIIVRIIAIISIIPMLIFMGIISLAHWVNFDTAADIYKELVLGKKK